MVLTVSNLTGFGGGGREITGEWTHYRASTGNLTTYTFTSTNIGAEAQDRVIVIGTTSSGSGSAAGLSSFTVGGIAGTVVSSLPGSLIGFGSGYVAVPTGTTATVEITFTIGSANCSVGVYAVYGLGPAFTVTSDTDTGTGTTLSGTLAIPAATNFVIGFGCWRTGGTISWGSTLVEDFDQIVETDVKLSGASFKNTAVSITSPGTTATSSAGANCRYTILGFT